MNRLDILITVFAIVCVAFGQRGQARRRRFRSSDECEDNLPCGCEENPARASIPFGFQGPDFTQDPQDDGPWMRSVRQRVLAARQRAKAAALQIRRATGKVFISDPANWLGDVGYGGGVQYASGIRRIRDAGFSQNNVGVNDGGSGGNKASLGRDDAKLQSQTIQGNGQQKTGERIVFGSSADEST